MESNGEVLYLITGASSAVAGAFIRRLDESLSSSDQSCAVVAQYNSSLEKLDALSHQLHHVKLFPEHCDASSPEEAGEFARRIATSYPPVDNILHTAAMPFSYTRLKDFDVRRALFAP